MTAQNLTGKADGTVVSVRALASQLRDLRDRVVTEVGRVVVGMEDVTRQFLIALVAGGHVLLEGVPGVAKTTLSKTFARVLGTEFQRIQFTPDLLPADVTGTYVFDRKANEFVLRKGPVFTQVLLADEVNRAPAKTQSALLEAMQENQVTIEGTTLAPPWRCPSRSWSWRLRTPSSRRASTACPRPSWTASSCA
jgi:MoxR-like ATPase